MGGEHHASGLERYLLYALAFSVLCVPPLVFIVLLNGILIEHPGYHWYERLRVLSRCCLAFLIFSSITAYAAACFVGGVFEALRRRRSRRWAVEERCPWHPAIAQQSSSSATQQYERQGNGALFIEKRLGAARNTGFPSG